MACAHPPRGSEAGTLRVVFAGTPEFAAHILQRLIAAPAELLTVAGVVTRPDQPRGRGMQTEPSAVGKLAAAHGLPVFKSNKIRTVEFETQLQAWEPDLLVVAAFGRILPANLLGVPRLMPLNVHASLLPKLRGASPIEGAILAGEAVTGVSIMRMVEQMDAGPILLQRSCEVLPDDTQASLKDRLAELGSEALLETIALLAQGRAGAVPQDESLATYTAPVKKEDGLIDWKLPADRIERMARAYNPWPVARAILAGEELRIFRGRVEARERADSLPIPGTIVAIDPEPLVVCGDGALLRLLEVQSPGKRRMPAAAFARGRRLTSGQRFEQLHRLA